MIAAPVSGTVVGLRFKTRGGVIQRGEPILDIVPANDDLLIDARVAPTDIDVVYPGLPAQVHLSAYAQRSLPRIEGKVRSVSADSLRDEKTGIVLLSRARRGRSPGALQLRHGRAARARDAGGGADVTGERTLFGYLLQPFRDMFRRSLREV